MRVCFVSALPSGTYFFAERLAEKMLRYTEVIILTNKSPVIKPHHPSSGVQVIESWSRNSPILPLRVCVAVKRLGCDIAVIQYEYSIFGRPLLSHLLLLITLKMLKLMNIRVAISLHGVLHPSVLFKNAILKRITGIALAAFYRHIASGADTIIVLNHLQKRLLESYGVEQAKVVVIPLGVERCKDMHTIPSGSRSEKIVMFQGFIRPSKGLLELIEAIEILNMRGLKVKLKIIGSVSYQFLERVEERNYLRRVITECRKHRDICILKLGFHSVDEILKEALNSDVIVLPYKDRFVESSGVLHMVMDCGRPIIVSRTPRFLGDLVPYIETVVVNPTQKELAEALYKLLVDKKLYEEVTKSLKQKAENSYWESIAEKWFDVLGY